jgi:hypothetical protein
MCTVHRNPFEFSLCKKNRCAILARRQQVVEDYQRNAEREARLRQWAKEEGRPYPPPDTTSDGYRLLKKIEKKRKK